VTDFDVVKSEFENKGLILLEDHYENCKTPMRCLCSKHQDNGEMLKTYDFVHNSMTYPCNKCRDEAVIGIPRTPVNEIKELLERNGFEYVDSYIVPKNLMVVAKCFNHKEPMMFKRTMSKLRSEDGYMKCPYCNTSRLEIKIGNVLQNMGIEYETQKKFDDLLGINGGKLSYDFYIPSLNVAIEGNGSQHYKPSETFGGEKQFEKQLEHDKRKREYALLHGFKLIEIPYYEFRFIENILAKELNLEVKEVS
jgi:Zn finger protein HypA/HybF involved in hydrogenase expression